MTRTAMFAALRPYAPGGRFTPDQVAAIDGLADGFGLPREATGLDEPAFFAGVRKRFGALTRPQVDGAKALLTALADWPTSWVAYALATAWHETARTLQPIKEMGGDAYFHRMYDPQGQRPQVAKRLGNIQPGDGARFAGRGYVQLTGRTNYERYGLGDRPDDAMRPEVAAEILKDGMAEGRFTGKKLSDYLPGDYVGARRIINGTDKAQEIAGHAVAFEAALKEAGR